MSHLVLVLGMHRSGTSAIAGALPCLGVSLGNRSSWSGPDNPNFHEDLDILAIDELLLDRFGAKWDSPTVDVLTHAWAATDIKAAATIAVHTKLMQFPLLAIKEPRMCRLLPFWRPVLANIGCEVSVVHVIRHPMAVAKSLEKRNSIPIEAGLALWLDHVTKQFAEVDDTWPSVTVRYETFMSNPVSQIGRAGLALNLDFDQDAADHYADEFISYDLWHEQADYAAVMPDGVVFAWERAVARALKTEGMLA